MTAPALVFVPLFWAVPAAQAAPGAGPGDVRRLVQALPAEAARFVRNCGRLFSEETLRHRAYDDPQKPSVHEVVSRYSFAAAGEKAQAIREVRQVLRVDGKPVKKDRSLEAIAAAVSGGSDKEKRKLLEQLERYGIQSFATDIGQLLLLFSQDQIANYEFTYQGRRYAGAQPLLLFSYQQTDGQGSMTVFQGKNVQRPKLSGEVWVSEGNYRLVRMSLQSTAPVSATVMSRHQMAVDYAWWPAADCLMPAAATHREYRNSFEVAENQYRYQPFQTFAAAAAAAGKTK